MTIYSVIPGLGGGANITWTATVSSAQANTDYQVKITVPYKAGGRSDFLDVRFWQGATSLSFYRESVSTGSSATFWVKVPTLNNGNTTINITADGVTSTDASNGPNTFMLFENFSGGVQPSNWVVRRASWTFSNNYATGTSWGSGQSYAPDLLYDLAAAYNWTDYSMECDMRDRSASDYPGIAVRVSDSNLATYSGLNIETYVNTTQATIRPFVNGSDFGWAYNWTQPATMSQNNWQRLRFDMIGANARVYASTMTTNPRGIIGDGLTNTLDTTISSTHYAVLRGTVALVNHVGYDQGPIDWDNVIVRKMQSTDPSAVTAV